ncbi:flagellar hook-basal body protein [Syntrophomonas palmitatica]|uniref:flagellar hook-basal body protein n=1 Tax=Syntrophomonas palmitatica TaxID=402877 RepID=UPI000A96DC7E
MMRSLYTASTGMYAQQLNVDTLAHNMANVNTAGFKKQRLEFQDLLYQTIKRPASGPNTMEPVGLEVGLGVKPSAINTIFKQGNLQQTENPLDVAIQGDGFFKITVGDQTMYTRDGAIKIDAAGNFTTADGNLYTGATPITAVGAYDINIAKDGTITYKVPGNDTPQEAGKLEIAKFMNPAGLQKVGKNLYQLRPIPAILSTGIQPRIIKLQFNPGTSKCPMCKSLKKWLPLLPRNEPMRLIPKSFSHQTKCCKQLLIFVGNKII